MEMQIYKLQLPNFSYYRYAILITDRAIMMSGNKALRILSKINLVHEDFLFRKLKIFIVTPTDRYFLHSTHIL